MIAPERRWSHFPHCPNSKCHRRLWVADGSRREVTPVRSDGTCPHCGTAVVPNAEPGQLPET
jgi:hypothetical protein